MSAPDKNAYRLQGKEPHIITLVLLSAFAAMGAILMTPALPEIAKYFHTSIGLTQLTVTSFLLGYAIGQLVYGPIANRFGRKPALFVGIALATAGSLFSILSSPVESFYLLIIGRFLEALGASAGLVISMTIINDFYYPEQIRRIMAFIMLSFAIMPGLGIAIGGILVEYIDWQACFYFLLLYGLVLIFPVRRLSETLVEIDHKALHYKHLVKTYLKMFRNKKLIGFSLCAGFSTACIYVFGAAGPFIGIQVLHISPAIYGLLGLTPFIGTLIGSLALLRFTHTNPLLVLKIAFLLELSAAFIMFAFFKFNVVTLLTLLIPMGFLCMGHPILAGTALPLAMRQSEEKAISTAVVNFVTMGMPVLITLLLGLLHIAESWTMPFIFLISLSLLACSYLFLCTKKEKN